MAKGMGNGFPIGGILISPVFEAKYGMLGTTFGGNHLACAAGVAVLDIIKKEKLIQNAETLGNYLFEELGKFKGIKELRGKGLMIGIELDHSVKQLREDLLFKHHQFTGVAGANTIRLLPSLALKKAEADRFLEVFSQYVK